MSITKQMDKNIFGKDTFTHNGQQQLPELVLPFGAVWRYPSAAAAFVLVMDNAMRHFVQVGDQETVRIQIDIDRNAGNHAGFYGKIAQAGAARA
ncbi:hypothetical protein D3C87_1573490 [compost metagenome]